MAELAHCEDQRLEGQEAWSPSLLPDWLVL